MLPSYPSFKHSGLATQLRVSRDCNMKNSAADMKEEPIVIDLEDDDVVLCGEMKDCMLQNNIVSADCPTKTDHHYMKLLDSFIEDGNSYLTGNPLKSIRYEVANGGYDRREFKPRNTIPVIRNRGDAHCIRKSKPHHHAEANRKKITKHELRQRETEKSVVAMFTSTRVETRKEGEIAFDESYRSYLTWLVENSKTSQIIQVKSEEDTMMSLSDSDIIAVGDHPFLDEEDSPFVPSKDNLVVDLEDRSGDYQQNSWFRKEIMNLLKQPYNEKEFLELKHEVSLRRRLTRCRQLLNGGELDVRTNQKTPSYLHKYPDFKRKFRKSLHEKDHRRALNLLRGFIFYLQKVSRDDAFKPWLDPECLKVTCF